MISLPDRVSRFRPSIRPFLNDAASKADQLIAVLPPTGRPRLRDLIDHLQAFTEAASLVTERAFAGSRQSFSPEKQIISFACKNLPADVAGLYVSSDATSTLFLGSKGAFVFDCPDSIGPTVTVVGRWRSLGLGRVRLSGLFRSTDACLPSPPVTHLFEGALDGDASGSADKGTIRLAAMSQDALLKAGELDQSGSHHAAGSSRRSLASGALELLGVDLPGRANEIRRAFGLDGDVEEVAEEEVSEFQSRVRTLFRRLEDRPRDLFDEWVRQASEDEGVELGFTPEDEIRAEHREGFGNEEHGRMLLTAEENVFLMECLANAEDLKKRSFLLEPLVSYARIVTVLPDWSAEALRGLSTLPRTRVLVSEKPVLDSLWSALFLDQGFEACLLSALPSHGVQFSFGAWIQLENRIGVSLVEETGTETPYAESQLQLTHTPATNAWVDASQGNRAYVGVGEVPAGVEAYLFAEPVRPSDPAGDRLRSFLIYPEPRPPSLGDVLERVRALRQAACERASAAGQTVPSPVWPDARSDEE